MYEGLYPRFHKLHIRLCASLSFRYALGYERQCSFLLPRHHLSLFLPMGPWKEFCYPALKASMPERNSRHSNNPSLVCSFLHSTTASKPHKNQNSHRQTESVEKERRKISDGPPNTTTRKKKHTHRHARMK
jgi:hypothetical protein